MGEWADDHLEPQLSETFGKINSAFYHLVCSLIMYTFACF